MAAYMINLLSQPARFQPPAALLRQPHHLNIVIASLSLGGAERIVLDIVHALRKAKCTGVLFVLNTVAREFPIESDTLFPCVSLAGLPATDQAKIIATQVLQSSNPVIVSHLVRSDQLRELGKLGVQVIPVIHNSAMGWQDPPTAFNELRNVPFVIAVSADVRSQLISAGLSKPVTLIRHELQRWKEQLETNDDREKMRRRYGISDSTIVVGMVGQFKAHKCYVRGVRALAVLRREIDAKLVIVGGWEHKYGFGKQAHEATVALSRELGVSNHLILTGPVPDATSYMSMFDVFLNTSEYEGLSIASLEAAQLGLPMVLSNVGGQRECRSHAPLRLIDDPNDVDAYVSAIKDLASQQSLSPAPIPRSANLVPRLWALVASGAGVKICAAPGRKLFVTSNLNAGGAQRSLTNLLTGIGDIYDVWLCVIDRVLGDNFIDQIRLRQIGLASVHQSGDVLEKAGDILALTQRLGVDTLVFWNVDAAVKLVLAKLLQHSDIRIIDVSPGPMLFEELAATSELQVRICLDQTEYIQRLDYFIAKYDSGATSPEIGRARAFRVIPNGVPAPGRRQKRQQLIRPRDVDPRFALVCCGRIVPNKCLENIVRMMRPLKKLQPLASLTIVGGVDQRHIGYFENVLALIKDESLESIHFVGSHGNPFDFLDQFRVFVMLSRNQGCPNASLEAMMMGLPVVANPNGGTPEQVIHGKTGFLVDENDPVGIATHINTLFENELLRLQMGAAARKHVVEHFSIGAMVASYRKVIWAPNLPK